MSASLSTDTLRIGIPSKGRLSELAEDLLSQAGLRFRRQNRGLFARVAGLPIDLIFLRTDDIPTLCAEGAIDMGVTGSDLVEEADADVTTRMNFGVGRCRLAFCVPDDSPIRSAAELDGKRIATSFPAVTARYLAQHDAKAHLVSLAGSVEVMIQLGVADAIVDLVETGSTLAANRLKILEEIGAYETVLIQGPRCRDTDTADRLVARLEGVVLARDYSMVEYNIPRSKLPEAEKITPGYNSPTVNSLEDSDWCSVQVMVRRGEVAEVMDRLKSIGASAIFEMLIHNCRL
ncbi:ATP phosphoribosyltransferase [Crateriforma conspicua]|uniref:ATP phosphoribosyltransferase n=1 Tax=Crateriforma conspicua TaxID=2527996 RepID=A0A5C5YBW5_9PLAN|nr:ATP phosphoribosyltransferase [Crateriforma conspicua]QDV61926.1 ATP phosphoribosyltransferase [Crateriforma conspicua]TWT71825.1 ATP phosphoribosyltransferase [Crateriforma conspicua]